MGIKELGRRIEHKMAQALDIPKDIILDLPKISMIGHLQLYIENHRGIVEYAPYGIRIAVSTGVIEITGKELTVRTISREDIHIEGLIECIRTVR